MNGIIIINKPKGYTSHDIVAILRKKLEIKKIGHTGTLDPNATGVLPLLIGNGTKFSKYLINHDKEYEVVLKLGIKTDTADGEGKILEERIIDDNILDTQNINKVLESFVGKSKQIPPIYSAIKVKGKKLYEYARSGIDVQIQPREIEIYKIELQDINKESKEIKFKVSCSKGTYIRSLCEDIAIKLGSIGYMKELNRTRVGNFKIEDAITIDEVKQENIINMEHFFKDYNKIELEQDKLKHFLNGVKISINKEDGIYNIYNNEYYIGIGIVKNNLLKRDIIC